MSISLAELKEKNITDLAKIAKELNIPGASGMRKQELIFQILRRKPKERPDLFRRRPRMSPRWIRISARPGIQLPPRPGRHLRFSIADPQFDLRTGDTVSARWPAEDGERYFALIKVEAVNFEDPEVARNKISSIT